MEAHKTPERGEENLYGTGQGLSLGRRQAFLRIAGAGEAAPDPMKLSQPHISLLLRFTRREPAAFCR